MKEFLMEVVLDSLLDTLKLLPFLFLTYLLMEFIEHKASAKVSAFLEKSGALGPLVGGALGVVPQCGFSAAAANLYTGRVITVGTLLAVFLSTSDEMLPLMISGGISAKVILPVLGYKLLVGILVGFAADLLLRVLRKKREPINIDELCENDHCHCERGILHSALHHTLHIILFIFLVFLAIGSLLFFLGEERLAEALDVPVLSYLVGALVGLVPSCAASIALTECYLAGVISVGTMLAGLLPGAGVGLLVLFRVNRHPKENLLLLGLLLLVGCAFGALADLIGLATLFA